MSGKKKKKKINKANISLAYSFLLEKLNKKLYSYFIKNSNNSKK